MNTEKKLLNLVIDHLEGAAGITAESDLVSIGYNSLKFIELVIKIEAEFETEFEDEYLNYHKFTTVKSVAEYLETRLVPVLQ